MGICKKADENIRNTIEMLLKEGINPIPVFVNAISKYCPQLPPPLPSRYSQAPPSFSSPAQAPPSFSNPAQTAPLPPYHAQKTDHILTEFDVKVGEKSNSRCGRGKYEHIDPVRVSFVEGQKRGNAVMVDGFKFRYVNKRMLAEHVVKYYRCEKKCGVFCHLFFDHNGCFVKAEKSCSQHTHING